MHALVVQDAQHSLDA